MDPRLRCIRFDWVNLRSSFSPSISLVCGCWREPGVEVTVWGEVSVSGDGSYGLEVEVTVWGEVTVLRMEVTV